MIGVGGGHALPADEILLVWLVDGGGGPKTKLLTARKWNQFEGAMELRIESEVVLLHQTILESW